MAIIAMRSLIGRSALMMFRSGSLRQMAGPKSSNYRANRLDELLDNLSPVSYTHLTLPTSDLV